MLSHSSFWNAAFDGNWIVIAIVTPLPTHLPLPFLEVGTCEASKCDIKRHFKL